VLDAAARLAKALQVSLDVLAGTTPAAPSSPSAKGKKQ
jgi:hypothetical protein